MLSLTLSGRRQDLPEGWSEAGSVAWPMLRALARRPQGEGKREAIRLLLGLNRRQFRRLSTDDVLALVAGLPWLSLAPISAPLRTSFRMGLRRHYWAAADFDDGTCLQYALADEYFTTAIQGTGPAANTAALRLLATLATPLSRHEESRERIEARANRLRKLPPEWTLQALMYWAGIREGMDARYGDFLFRGSPLDKGGSSVPSFGWWSAFQDVAEGRVFGNLPDVYRANFHEVAQWMLRKEAARRAQLLEMERMKTRN